MAALHSQAGPPPDPARLVELIMAVGAQRDRAAFAELFAHFAPRIKAYLVKRGTVAGEAEDLAQEAMIMVWRRAATYDPAKAGASTWIFTIARNKRIDALRRERHPEYDPQDPAVAAALAPVGPEAADQAAVATQRAERLSQAIAALPAEQAELVRMAYFEDKAHGRIAEETALPLGTVKSRLRLALGHLRKAVGEDAL